MGRVRGKKVSENNNNNNNNNFIKKLYLKES
jgi:hypothetical protein